MTSTSRRALLSATALGAVGAPFAAMPEAVAGPRSLYSRVRFVPQRHRRFRLVDGRRRWTVTLTKISDLSRSAKDDNKNFGLTFVSRTPGPSQGTYVLRRPGFTPTRLFMVPTDASRRTYYAIVSRAPRK